MDFDSIYVTSDTHFYHKLCARDRGFIKEGQDPMEGIHAMNDFLVERINERVGERDILFHLGDWAFASRTKQAKLRKRIRCSQIYLIRGNHDSGVNKDLFPSVWDLRRLKVWHPNGKEKLDFVMCHYPMITWNKKSHGAFHLHGHCHGNLTLPECYDPGKMMDVGVDTREDLAPYSLQEIYELLKDKETTNYDHHDGTR